jgi:hypothetical protein
MIKSKHIHFATAAAFGAAIIGVSTFANMNAYDQTDTPLGLLDMPAKHYAAEVVLGVSDGMKENGWFNPAIEDRLAAVNEGTNKDFRSALSDVYDQAYEQGLTGQWDEASLDGYLEAIEMPRDKLYYLNALSLEEKQSHNPVALRSIIDAKFGARWDAVGQHFREGVEGLILTTAISDDLIKQRHQDRTLFSDSLPSPVVQAVQQLDFMTHGPNEGNLAQAAGWESVAPVVERIEIDDTPREKVAVELDRHKKAVTWSISSDLQVADPFTAEPAVQRVLSDTPDPTN